MYSVLLTLDLLRSCLRVADNIGISETSKTKHTEVTNESKRQGKRVGLQILS